MTDYENISNTAFDAAKELSNSLKGITTDYHQLKKLQRILGDTLTEVRKSSDILQFKEIVEAHYNITFNAAASNRRSLESLASTLIHEIRPPAKKASKEYVESLKELCANISNIYFQKEAFSPEYPDT